MGLIDLGIKFVCVNHFCSMELTAVVWKHREAFFLLQGLS